MIDIGLGGKIVYDNTHRQEYIKVKTIKDFKTDRGGKITLINKKYATTGPLRNPTKEELKNQTFI